MHSSSSLSHTLLPSCRLSCAACGVLTKGVGSRFACALSATFARVTSMDYLLWLMAHVVATVEAKTQGKLFWALYKGACRGERLFFPRASGGSKEDDLAPLEEAIRVR